VFTGDRILDGHAVVIDGERITGVAPLAEAPGDARTLRLPPTPCSFPASSTSRSTALTACCSTTHRRQTPRCASPRSRGAPARPAFCPR